MLPGRKATLLGLVLQLTVIVVKYSSVSVYSSSTSFFLVFTKIFLCSLTNNVISRVAWSEGYSARTCSLSPAPIDCRCREIFIHFAAVFLPYSHIYLCTAAISTTHLTRNWIDDLRGKLAQKGKQNDAKKKKEIKNKRTSIQHCFFIFDSHGHYKKIQIDRIISQKPKVLQYISNSQDVFTNFL